MRLGFQIQTYNWYTLSKALAEQEAWKFAKESGSDLVKIHPGFTFGPFLQPNLNLSVELMLNLINGNLKYAGPCRFVDVRDIAYAHIQAVEVSTANGRYLVAGKVIQLSQVLKIFAPTLPCFAPSREVCFSSIFISLNFPLM